MGCAQQCWRCHGPPMRLRLLLQGHTGPAVIWSIPPSEAAVSQPQLSSLHPWLAGTHWTGSALRSACLRSGGRLCATTSQTSSCCRRGGLLPFRLLHVVTGLWAQLAHAALLDCPALRCGATQCDAMLTLCCALACHAMLAPMSCMAQCCKRFYLPHLNSIIPKLPAKRRRSAGERWAC